jgi:hypothetical protein
MATMRRKILAISREEIEAHFAENSRQDVKVVTAELLSYDLFKVLKARGKDLKMEEVLTGMMWKHSHPDLPNSVCPAAEFIEPNIPQYAHGPFGLSLASGTSIQDEHYHKQHLEICIANEAISVEFRAVEETECETITLPKGGVLVFCPNVIHKLKPGGLIILIELPSLARDKYDAKLHDV